MILELSWSTLEELEEQNGISKEDQQKKFAYLTILTIFKSQLRSQDLVIKVWLRVLNLKLMLLETHFDTYMSRMHHVLSVMFLPELGLSWCQLKPCVHRPGLESTMATSWLNTSSTTDPHITVLTLIQNQFQGKAVIQILHFFTTRLLIAMASRVHRMKMVANSHVLCAQSDLLYTICMYLD